MQFFTATMFCPAHPHAAFEVVGTEDPEPESAIARVHGRCGECGLGWTGTLTVAPMKDHVAVRHNVRTRHNDHWAKNRKVSA